MFEEIPAKETQNNINNAPLSKAKRRRKKQKAAKQRAAKQRRARNEIPSNTTNTNKTKICPPMSTWAENFTTAATWQLKHQIAYWKAKAKALEYENVILHDIIRQNNIDDEPSDESNSVSHSEETEQNNDTAGDGEDCEDGHADEDFEVSEEFIQFLATNAKYKEEAKKERERLAGTMEEESLPQPEPHESTEEKQAKLKELYGSHWQRISALEIAIQSEFIQDADLDKPMYWPNIPFNF